MLLVNGEAQQQLPVSDRGLAYGDGVWETIAIKQGQPQLLEWHFTTFTTRSASIKIVPVDWATLESEIYTRIDRKRLLSRLLLRVAVGAWL